MTSPETEARIKTAIKKAYSEALGSPDFKNDLLRLIQKEQEKVKQYVLQSIKEIKEVNPSSTSTLCSLFLTGIY